MGDLFHESMEFYDIARVFSIMALAPQHTYPVLTKRADRMLAFYRWLDDRVRTWDREIEHEEFLIGLIDHNEESGEVICDAAAAWLSTWNARHLGWPLPNVWIGATITNQPEADRIIPILLQAPAAKRWLSIEPMLGPIDLTPYLGTVLPSIHCQSNYPIDGISWVVVGGETGPGARPLHPAWVRSVRDQCQQAGVPFFFKSWGAWKSLVTADEASHWQTAEMCEFKDGLRMVNIGKKAAGRLIDGRTWDGMPEVHHGA